MTVQRDQIERHLRGIINHWNEFGPEYGLDELMTHASMYLASYAANAPDSVADQIRETEKIEGLGAATKLSVGKDGKASPRLRSVTSDHFANKGE